MDLSYYKNKTVLVAGGSGFVGTWLCKKLINYGANVTATYFNSKLRHPVDGVKYVRADLRGEDECRNVTKNQDVVFMAAAQTSGAAVIQSAPLSHLTPNIVMNAFMLASSYENSVKRFCFISSNTVYPVTDFPVTEEDVTGDFFDKYEIVAGMKLFSEKMCEMYAEKVVPNMETLVVRPGNLYGPFDKFTKKESKVVAALIRRAIEKEDPFVVWGDGNDIKDFLYIEDFVDCVLGLSALSEVSGVYNIASGQPISIKQILDLIFSSIGTPPENLEFDKTKPTMIPKRLIDIQKVIEKTGWIPKTNMEAGINKTMDWYKEFYKDYNPENLK